MRTRSTDPPPTNEADLAPGTAVGEDVIEGPLGKGGFGEVFRGVHRLIGKRVAIKVLARKLASDPEAVSRFVAEARAVNAIGHRSIIDIFAFDVLPDGRYYYVMELLDGEPLDRYLATVGRLTVAEALPILRTIARALDAAHAKGIAHRDLKPENIFLARDDDGTRYPKLLDFGIAKLISPVDAVAHQTTPGTPIGTPLYMSPEQCLGRDVDHRTDIYALGVLTYRLLTGELPFSGGFVELLSKHISDEPPLASSRVPGLPQGVDRAIAAMLEKAPDKRPLTASAAVASLPAEQPELLRARPSSPSLPLPAVHYAKSGDLHIAYQIVGDGPVDLIYVPGFTSHIGYAWEYGPFARFLRKLGSFARLIWFDKRGTGMSDRVEVATLEQRMDDVRAVMDAAGSGRAVLLGQSEGGPMCMLFAATYPERTLGLITYATFARRVWTADYPWAPTFAARESSAAHIAEHWGEETAIDLSSTLPSVGSDPDFQRWFAAYERFSASPGGAISILRMNNEIDVRDVLQAVRVPTLVLHRTGDRDVRVEEGRFIASRIHGAKFVELPGADHDEWVGDSDSVVREIEVFVGAIGTSPDHERVLFTVFAAAVAAPTSVDLQAIVRRELARCHGRKIAATGHVVAVFDGPARAVRCARAIRDIARGLSIDVRVGLHTGECEVKGEEVSGLAVDIATALAHRARPNEVLATGTVRDLVAGSGLVFEERPHPERSSPLDHLQILAVV